MAGELSFFSLGVEDAERGRAFYESLFRLAARDGPVGEELHDRDAERARRHPRRRSRREPVPLLRGRGHRRRGRARPRAGRRGRGGGRRRRRRGLDRKVRPLQACRTIRARGSGSTPAARLITAGRRGARQARRDRSRGRRRCGRPLRHMRAPPHALLEHRARPRQPARVGDGPVADGLARGRAAASPACARLLRLRGGDDRVHAAP